MTERYTLSEYYFWDFEKPLSREEVCRLLNDYDKENTFLREQLYDLIERDGLDHQDVCPEFG